MLEVAACREVLDRGYGKSTQTVQAEADPRVNLAEEIRKARRRAQRKLDGEEAEEREAA